MSANIQQGLKIMGNIKELKSFRIHDSVDARNAYEELRDYVRKEREHFSGSMKFKLRGNSEYLIYRPCGSSTQRSLGRRNAETEKVLCEFNEGKVEVKDRIRELKSRIAKMAPVIKVHGFGRVPDMVSRVLRKFDDLGWLGTSAIVAGSNSLFAYEIAAGVRILNCMESAGEPDVLHDTNRKLSFVGCLNKRSFMGILQSLDSSFRRLPVKTVSAMNGNGFKVEIREPASMQNILACGCAEASNQSGDSQTGNSGNGSLPLNVPKFEATVFDRKGNPLRMSALDPRIFALHGKWQSKHAPSKVFERKRNAVQAEIAANIAVVYLGLKFDHPDMAIVSKDILRLADEFKDCRSRGN